LRGLVLAFRDVYDPAVTDLSLQELLRFGRWTNTVYGYHPIVVGGWAVYFYARSLGSKDIDIILPTRRNIERVMNEWYSLSGYDSIGELERMYFKQVQTERGPIRIEMDVASYQDRNVFREKPALELPWTLCNRYAVAHRERNVDFRIPSKELLLVQKTKALRDRRHRLAREVLSDLQREVVISKIWKDEQDIRALERVNVDEKACLEIVRSDEIADLLQEEWRRLKVF
jgi:hypothetical protein